MPDTRDWTPREYGDGLYCSPACGMGCTRQEYVRACIEARSVADTMGDGWKVRVWENLGWHWAVERGEVRCGALASIRYAVAGGYRVLLRTIPSVHAGSYDDPETAVREALVTARQHAAALDSAIRSVAGPEFDEHWEHTETGATVRIFHMGQDHAPVKVEKHTESGLARQIFPTARISWPHGFATAEDAATLCRVLARAQEIAAELDTRYPTGEEAKG